MTLRPIERLMLAVLTLAVVFLAVYMRSVSQSLAVIASPAPIDLSERLKTRLTMPPVTHTPACAADCPLCHCILDEDE